MRHASVQMFKQCTDANGLVTPRFQIAVPGQKVITVTLKVMWMTGSESSLLSFIGLMQKPHLSDLRPQQQAAPP